MAVNVAVNGTLMRGLELNPNMINAGATFVREATTVAAYCSRRLVVDLGTATRADPWRGEVAQAPRYTSLHLRPTRIHSVGET